MKVIDLEAHFDSHEYAQYLRSRGKTPEGPAPQLQESLLDLGEGRLKVMDAAGIDMQVLSLGSPNTQLFEAPEGMAWSRKVNDELSAVIKKYPDRFIGLAAMAPDI